MTSPPVDGRQSGAALAIARGTQRLLLQHGFFSLPELPLPNGRRADLIAVGPKETIAIIEIKSSVMDFRTDHKWSEYIPYCDTFWFAVAPEFPADILPASEGLIIADKYGAAFARDRAPIPLPPARRRGLIATMARSASYRLQTVADPEAMLLARGAEL